MKEIFTVITILTISLTGFSQSNHTVFPEAENFENKGGWVVDQQFMDLMGSSYLMAHGMGVPVSDAETSVEFPSTGEYTIFVRTYNWTSSWHDGDGPGKFQLMVAGEKTSPVLGASGSEWLWQNAGKVNIKSKNATIALHDLTGFNGRVDAIYFTKGNTPPPNELATLEKFRKKQFDIPKKPVMAGEFDLVVVGGGVAGRNISVTHVALGTVRVMRTTGMMGEVVGMAASLANKYDTNPRSVYQNHLDELKSLMQKGVGKNWYE